MNIYINNIAKWKVSRYDYLDPQMGLRSISLTINHPSNWIDGDAVEVADFTDAYVMYKGEKFKLSISKPTAEKKNSTLDYEYKLVFKGSEDELTRRKVRDLAEVGVNKYISQGTSFSLSASTQQFKQLLDNNLRYYFGNDWNVIIAGESQDSARIDINNTSIWELLQKTYEYYGLRWNIKNKTITIGYEPVLIDHIFDYGKEGGLVKITRTAQNDSTPNRITGTGGSRNLPKNYFTNRYSDFRPDPDVISDSVNIKNLMPRVFRDSVRSGTLPYIDYVEDEQLVALNGVREDALAPNEDIYPSIAGVEVAGLGRIDEIIYSDIPLYNRPEESEITEWDEEGNPIPPNDNYSPTFDIWVKDIGFDLADEKYTSTEDAKISFTTGDLAGYEFTILSKGKRKEGDIVKDKEVYSDTSKSHSGVNSAYKITLIKSDEDFDATNRMLPNTVFYPRAGDSFVIYNIEMPQSYVENAELRLQRWLEAQLEELKAEKPTYAIEIMPSFFKTAELEFDGVSIEDKLEAGNLIRVMNASVTGEMQTLHINNLTVEYKDLLPKYRFTVTDKVSVDGNAVGRLQSQLDAVISRQLLTEKEIDAILSGFSTKFLSKVRPDAAQGFIQFLKGISVEELATLTEGLEIGDYTPGFLGGGGAFKMKDGISELEVDKLTVRMIATFFEIVVSKISHIGGQLLLTPARMKCVNVVETDVSYLCYFDKGENGEAVNEFQVGDQARCQVFTGSGTKFYWRLVTAIGVDYIELSKTDKLGDSIPAIGDDIIQLGNRTNKERRNAIILSTVGSDAPSWKQYEGINSFSLEGKETTVFSSKGNRIQGKTVFTSGGSNLDDYLDNAAQDIEEAKTAINEVDEKINNTHVGTANLLLNTGFWGDFNNLNVDVSTVLSENKPIDTNSLVHWVHSNAEVIDAPSRSGKGVKVGSIQQTVNLKAGEHHIISFWAKGASLNIGLVDTTAILLTSEYKRYSIKTTTSQAGAHTFSMTGTAEVYEIVLSEGNAIVSYSYSERDDVKAISQLQAINTITSAIKEGNTQVLGGLILSTMIQLGKYKDGIMEKVTSGINGIWNSDEDPAIWAGGTFNQAIATVQKFKDNPSYQPTEEEWSEMAKMVLTHGGDGFFRGYIHALGGIFRGKVESNKDGKRFIIDPATRTLKMVNSQGMLLTELAFSDSIGDNYSNITLHYYDTNDVRRRTLVVNGLSGIRMMEFAEDGNTLVNTTAFRYDRIIYKGIGVITGEPEPESLEPYQLWHDSDGYVRYMKPPTE